MVTRTKHEAWADRTAPFDGSHRMALTMNMLGPTPTGHTIRLAQSLLLSNPPVAANLLDYILLNPDLALQRLAWIVKAEGALLEENERLALMYLRRAFGTDATTTPWTLMDEDEDLNREVEIGRRMWNDLEKELKIPWTCKCCRVSPDGPSDGVKLIYGWFHRYKRDFEEHEVAWCKRARC